MEGQIPNVKIRASITGVMKVRSNLISSKKYLLTMSVGHHVAKSAATESIFQPDDSVVLSQGRIFFVNLPPISPPRRNEGRF